MNCLFSLVFVFKLSICVVALSSLYSKLRFSSVAQYVFRPLKELSKFELATKCQSMKQQYQLYVCLLAKNNLNDTRKRNLFKTLRMCVCVFFFNYKRTGSSVQYFAKNNISPKMSTLEIFFLKKFLWQPNWTRPTASSNFGCPRNFFIQLFPNWTACSPITYTNPPLHFRLESETRAKIF